MKIEKSVEEIIEIHLNQSCHLESMLSNVKHRSLISKGKQKSVRCSCRADFSSIFEIR